MPKEFPSSEYYWVVDDTFIPRSVGKKNIVFSVKGLQEIAEYYQEKYGIEIQPFNATQKTAPNLLYEKISQLRKKTADLESYRCGLILINREAGAHGHGMPMIWEKNGTTESLFFLDTGQFFGDISYVDYSCDFVSMPSFTSETDLSKVPGYSNHAYVLAGDDVYLIDKEHKKSTNLILHQGLFGDKPTRDNKKLAAFKQFMSELTLDSIEENMGVTKLSEKELDKILAFVKYDRNEKGKQAIQFRQELLKQLPELKLWSSKGYRQLDLSSCMTDAIVVLKDGLRLFPSFSKAIESKKIKKIGDVNLFNMPEELLKTAQVSSYAAEKSKSDLTKVIHTHNVKDASGKKTGETKSVSLGEFRKKYEAKSDYKNENKLFGYFTITKGKKLAEIIKKRWEMKQDKKIKVVLEDLANNPDSQFGLFTKDNSEDARKMLLMVCDYIDIVEQSSNKYDSAVLKNASIIKQLLSKLSNDNVDPNYVKVNFEKLKIDIKYSYEFNLIPFINNILEDKEPDSQHTITPK